MKCKEVENNIVDYVDNQLSVEHSEIIKSHIESCAQCKIDYEETTKLLVEFNKETTQIPSAKLRSNFYDMLEEEKRLSESKVVTLQSDKGFNFKMAFQIAASFLLLFLGFYAGNYSSQKKTSEEIATLEQQTVELKENMMLAMIDNRSASKRIKAVNYSEEIKHLDQKILNVLVDRMHNDTNINVRLAAAEALAKYSETELVKKAFIEALTTETDPSLQITIIEFLVKIQDERALEPMQQLLDQPETPDFVKEHANTGILQII